VIRLLLFVFVCDVCVSDDDDDDDDVRVCDV